MTSIVEKWLVTANVFNMTYALKKDGKLTGYNFKSISDEQKNLTELGFEPETSGLMYQRSYQLSYSAPYWWSLSFNM